MSKHIKQYNTLNEMLLAGQSMNKFQTIHNVIRKDYIELLTATESNKSIEITFDALYRASLRSLFSLIEADIYGLNSIDRYHNYKDSDAFLDKFKNTFKQIAKTWKKEEIQKKYIDSKLMKLRELRKMRDELIHPKEIRHIHKANEADFEKLKTVFYEYDSFINDLMYDFFLSVTIPDPFLVNLNH